MIFFSCLAIFILAHQSLLISGGAVLVSKYKSSTLVGFSYPAITLHAWLNSGSSRVSSLDLDHTVAAYSATE